MKFIDAHAHLSNYLNIEKVLLKANEKKVEKIVAVSTDLETSLKTLEITKQYPKKITAALGVHPNHVKNTDPHKILNLISNNLKKISAVGEIGLDYSRTKDVKIIRKQQKTFQRFLNFARENKMTASIHSRMAHKDAFNLTVKHGPEKAVFHWFDGPIEILEKILQENFYISTTPAIETSRRIQSIIKKTPLNKILIETDCPVYMKKYDRNAEPSDVIITAKSVASLKSCSLEKVAEETSRNAEYLFNINE